MALGMLSSLSLNFAWSDLLLCSVLVLSALLIGSQIASLRQRQRQADVTESKQELQCLQEHLEQQVQTMDTILSASPDHFYMFDRDGRFIYASRAGLQALGLQKSDIIPLLLFPGTNHGFCRGEVFLPQNGREA